MVIVAAFESVGEMIDVWIALEGCKSCVDHSAGDQATHAALCQRRLVLTLTVGASMDSAFGSRLRALRQAARLSQNELGRRASINPGTVNRLEAGEREPTGREQVEALAEALALTAGERDALLADARLLPAPLERLGAADAMVVLVADILSDEGIPLAERDEFRWLIALVARRWRPAAVGPPAPVASGAGLPPA